jgi:trans-aconitate methyltransferase
MKISSILGIILIIGGLVYILGPGRLYFSQLSKNKGQWTGEYYDQNSSPQYQVALNALSTVDLKSYHTILDIGCGSGKITALIAQKAPESRVVGVDASESMIKAAQEKYKLPHLSFQVADALNVPYQNEFDLALSFSCIHWIKNKDAVFAGIAKALKPQGTVLVTGCIKVLSDPIFRAFMDLKNKEPWKAALANINPESQLFPLEKEALEKSLINAGFRPIEIKEIHLPVRFKNKHALAAWLQGWFGGLSFVAQLPKDKQEALLAAVVEQYLTHMPLHEDGSVDYTWPTMMARAQKST